MGLSAALCLLAFAPPQSPPPTVRPNPPAIVPEVVLAGAAEPVPLAEFGLGDGGVGTAERGELRWTDGGCTTPGGVRIECLPVGVKLTFPSGRELLVAPDGRVHLRSGELAGPFDAGLELRLGDGSSVRIALAQSARDRLRDVFVCADDRMLQPWRRGEETTWVDRPRYWGGIRLCCCGDGGELYRAIALGPLVVLDRVLVPADREASAPRERLVVLTAPLVQSLETMQRQHREPDAAVRRAVAAVAAVADRAGGIFPAGAALHRAEQHRLRWVLRGGFELELGLDGPMAPRLCLVAGDSSRAMVEWTLRADAAAFLANPRDDRPDQRWHGNGTRLPKVAVELQARAELLERPLALGVLGRLKK